jgi:hypothetical protein
MEGRNVLEREGWNAKFIARPRLGWMQQAASQAISGSCNEQLALFTTERKHALLQGVAFSKNYLQHRSV